MSIEKKFGGDITVETAELIKELKESGGGGSGVLDSYTDVVLEDYDLLADRDISDYLPESTVGEIPAENLTDSLCKALEEAVKNGVNFYVWREDAMCKATLQNVYSEEDPTIVISMEVTSDIFDTPDYWSALSDTEYGADCFVFTDTPAYTNFTWFTESVE